MTRHQTCQRVSRSSKYAVTHGYSYQDRKQDQVIQNAESESLYSQVQTAAGRTPNAQFCMRGRSRRRSLRGYESKAKKLNRTPE